MDQGLLPGDTYLGVLQFGSETYGAWENVRFEIGGGFELGMKGREEKGNGTTDGGGGGGGGGTAEGKGSGAVKGRVGLGMLLGVLGVVVGGWVL